MISGALSVSAENAASITTYEQLLAAIRQTRSASEQRVEQAVEQEKVREAWETGKLIDEHVLQHQERADYGARVIVKLAKDLETSETELKYMLQFARAYPIRPAPDELSWAHYRELLSLNDAKDREQIKKMANKEGWSSRDLRLKVQERTAAKQENPAPVREAQLTTQPGKTGTYKIVKAAAGPDAGKMVIDLGFSNYYKTSRDLRFKEGAMVEAVPAFPGKGSAPSDKIKFSKRTAEDLYTYRAYVVEILDGDTVKAVIDLGFGIRSVQTLRLRGLDAPEIVSREGKEAKNFLEKLLRKEQSAERIEKKTDSHTLSAMPYAPCLVRTMKSDKYDRYLIDLWVNGEYVNQRLIDAGYAVRVSD